MSAFITRRKRPSVSSIKGPKKSLRNGLIVRLISMRITPRIKTVTTFPERIKFGTKYAAAINASVFERILKIIFVINPIDITYSLVD